MSVETGSALAPKTGPGASLMDMVNAEAQKRAGGPVGPSAAPRNLTGRNQYNDPEDPLIFMGGSTTGQRAKPPGWNLMTKSAQEQWLKDNSTWRAPMSTGFDVNDGGVYQKTSDALAEFYRWSPKKQKEWGDYLVSLGLLDESDNNFDGQLAGWKRVLSEGASFTQVGKKLDPRSVAQLLASSGTSLSGSQKQPGFSGNKQMVEINANLIDDPEVARSSVNQLIQQAYGRDLAPGELEAFIETLNKAKELAPEKTTTTSTYVDGDETQRNVVKTGGVDATSNLLNQMKSKPEYGAYQAATTYMGALMDAVKAPV